MFGVNQAEWQARMPPLTRENQAVVEIWRFCAGWNPALFELAVAVHPVDDVDLLLQQLQLLRARLDAHEATQRKAAHGPK